MYVVDILKTKIPYTGFLVYEPDYRIVQSIGKNIA